MREQPIAAFELTITGSEHQDLQGVLAAGGVPERFESVVELLLLLDGKVSRAGSGEAT